MERLHVVVAALIRGPAAQPLRRITFKRIERYRKYLVDPVVEEEAAATA